MAQKEKYIHTPLEALVALNGDIGKIDFGFLKRIKPGKALKKFKFGKGIKKLASGRFGSFVKKNATTLYKKAKPLAVKEFNRFKEDPEAYVQQAKNRFRLQPTPGANDDYYSTDEESEQPINTQPTEYDEAINDDEE